MRFFSSQGILKKKISHLFDIATIIFLITKVLGEGHAWAAF
jgi:hypothetical protein